MLSVFVFGLRYRNVVRYSLIRMYCITIFEIKTDFFSTLYSYGMVDVCENALPTNDCDLIMWSGSRFCAAVNNNFSLNNYFFHFFSLI